MVKNGFLAFDETLGEIGSHSIGVVGDYIVYQNKPAITTQNCFDEIKKLGKFTDTQLSYLRGLFEDELISMEGLNPKQSIITHLNYISQFKPIILLTENEYEQRGSDNSFLNKAVKVMEFSEFITNIESDENFEVWKLKTQRDMLLQQKMDSDAKQKHIEVIDKQLNKNS